MNLATSTPKGAIRIPDTLAVRSLEICHEIAQRLRSPEAVQAAVCRPDNVWPNMRRGPLLAGQHPWTAGSLANGFPGIALLHTALTPNDPSLRSAAHDHLAAAVTAPRTGSVGLFGWDGSIALVAALSAAQTGAYTRLLATLEPALVRTAQAIIERQLDRWSSGRQGVAWEAYDTIVGLTGIGRELLLAVDSGRKEFSNPLRRILAFLVTVSKPIDVDGHRVPGWWTPPHAYVNNQDKALYAKGDFNVGVAHGIGGPLALFALSLLHGIAVEGQLDAMRRITDWLLSWRGEDADGCWWPARVPWEEQIKPTKARTALPHLQPSWCYGTPGVARAMQLAGRALGEAALERAAVSAMHGVFNRPPEQWHLSDADLCHGYAGLLQVTWRIATDSGDPRLANEVPRLIDDVITRYDPSSAFGFQYMVWADGDADAPFQAHWHPLDVAGALEGAAGIALALHSAVSDPRQETFVPWDAALLLC